MITFQMNSPLDELLVSDSVSLSHSFTMSAAASGLLSSSHSGEVGSVGESCVKDVLIISDAGPVHKIRIHRSTPDNSLIPLLC